MKGQDDAIRETPLVERLIEGRIKTWMKTGFAIAASGASEDGQQALDELKNLHFSGIEYGLVPRIVSDLRRAGLLTERDQGKTA